MKPTLDRSRRVHSRLFGVPAPPCSFEPLAIIGGLVCLAAHFVAIPALKELAASGGIIEGELPGWYHTTIRILLASHPGVRVDYLVGVLDAIRSAGAIRVAIPPIAHAGE